MNSGTKLRTALRVVFSIYSAFCMWEVAIKALADQINAPWLISAVAIIIVLSGLAVDVITTYFNNDYTEAGAIGTGITRQIKKEEEEGYIGEVFFSNNDEEETDAQ